MSKSPSLDQVRKIMDHDRALTAWVCCAIVKADGKPAIHRIARIVTVYPRDGAGTLRVCVSDWGTDPAGTPDGPRHYIGRAGGYGYDKFAAAVNGATVGGVKLGNHCNRDGAPTLRDLCHARGWEIIGSGAGW